MRRRYSRRSSRRTARSGRTSLPALDGCRRARRGRSAAEQPGQHRFGLIVRGVSYGYARGQALFDDAIKECVAQASGGVFEIQMLPFGRGRNILPLADTFEAELARQVGYKLRVCFRVAPRNAWLKCATSSVMPSVSRRSARSRRSTTESAPPETATATRSPGTAIRERRNIRIL